MPAHPQRISRKTVSGFVEELAEPLPTPHDDENELFVSVDLDKINDAMSNSARTRRPKPGGNTNRNRYSNSDMAVQEIRESPETERPSGAADHDTEDRSEQTITQEEYVHSRDDEQKQTDEPLAAATHGDPSSKRKHGPVTSRARKRRQVAKAAFGTVAYEQPSSQARGTSPDLGNDGSAHKSAAEPSDAGQQRTTLGPASQVGRTVRPSILNATPPNATLVVAPDISNYSPTTVSISTSALADIVAMMGGLGWTGKGQEWETEFFQLPRQFLQGPGSQASKKLGRQFRDVAMLCRAIPRDPGSEKQFGYFVDYEAKIGAKFRHIDDCVREVASHTTSTSNLDEMDDKAKRDYALDLKQRVIPVAVVALKLAFLAGTCSVDDEPPIVTMHTKQTLQLLRRMIWWIARIEKAAVAVLATMFGQEPVDDGEEEELPAELFDRQQFNTLISDLGKSLDEAYGHFGLDGWDAIGFRRLSAGPSRPVPKRVSQLKTKTRVDKEDALLRREGEMLRRQEEREGKEEEQRRRQATRQQAAEERAAAKQAKEEEKEARREQRAIERAEREEWEVREAQRRERQRLERLAIHREAVLEERREAARREAARLEEIQHGRHNFNRWARRYVAKPLYLAPEYLGEPESEHTGHDGEIERAAFGRDEGKAYPDEVLIRVMRALRYSQYPDPRAIGKSLGYREDQVWDMIELLRQAALKGQQNGKAMPDGLEQAFAYLYE